MECPKKTYNLAFKFELKLYTALRTFLIISQAFGVAPVGAHYFEPPRRRWWTQCLHCVHYSWCSVIYLGLSSSIYIEYTTFNISLPTIQKPLFFSEYLVYLVHVAFIITACYYNKTKFSRFLQTIVAVDCNLTTFGVTPHYAALARFFIFHLWLLVVYTAATAAVDYFYCGEEIIGFLRSMTVYVVPNFIIGLSMSQYYALMYAIRLRCSSVAKSLRKFKKQYRSEEASNEVDSWIAINRLREILSVLDAFTKEVNSAFGYSILMTYSGSFLIASLNIFLIYKYVDQKTQINIPLTVYSVIWVALHLAKMWLILYYSHMVVREKDNIIVELSDIQPFNEKLKIALRRLLLQLMVDSRAHVVCGLLDLSMSFMRPVIDLKLKGPTIIHTST